MPRRYRRAFIAPRYRVKARGMASRASDFYRRTAPFLKRTAPIWLPTVRKAVKSAPKLDRAVKVITEMRRKFRRPTLTKTTKKPGTAMEYMNTPSEGNSTSYFTRKALRLRGMTKKMMYAMPVQLRKSESTHTLTWAYGRQSIFTFIHNTDNDLNNTIALIPGYNNTTRLLLQSTKIHYMLSSGAKAGIKLRIYEGCYKKDAESAFTPRVLWANGMIDTGSVEVPENIDSKPFASVSFMRYCHISKVTNVFLPQGRTHEHYVDYRYNKIWNREDGNVGGTEYMRGWTRFTMFVAYGEPIADTDLDVSTASGRLLIVATKTHRYRYASPVNYTSNFVQSIPVTGITTERLLDEGSGEIESNTVL